MAIALNVQAAPFVRNDRPLTGIFTRPMPHIHQIIDFSGKKAAIKPSCISRTGPVSSPFVNDFYHEDSCLDGGTEMVFTVALPEFFQFKRLRSISEESREQEESEPTEPDNLLVFLDD